jgi:hypothetical protein
MVNMQIEVEVSEERTSKLGKRGPASDGLVKEGN